MSQYAAIQRYKAARANYIAFNELIKSIKSTRIRLKKRTTRRSWYYYAYSTLYSKKSNFCVYCGEWKVMTREHLIPRSYGGTLIVSACRKCNNERGNSLSYRPFINYCINNPRIYIKAINDLNENISFCKCQMR